MSMEENDITVHLNTVKVTLYQKPPIEGMIVNTMMISATGSLFFLSMERCHTSESWTWKDYYPGDIAVYVFLVIHSSACQITQNDV